MEQTLLTDNQIEEEIEKGILPDGKFDSKVLYRLNQAGVMLHFSGQGIRWFRDQLNVSSPL